MNLELDQEGKHIKINMDSVSLVLAIIGMIIVYVIFKPCIENSKAEL